MVQPTTRRLAALSTAALIALTLGAPVASAAGPTDLFISEYVEGSSNNKAIELYNGTGAPVNLATGAYFLDVYINGAITPTASIPLSGTIANNDVYVIANPASAPAVLGVADATNASLTFNGNDAVALQKGQALLDIIGQIAVDPGPVGWGVDPTNTVDNTLVRKPTISAGRTSNGVFDPATEWDGFAVDTFSNLGFHVVGTGGGGGGVDTGTVGAHVTVPSSAACIELSTTTIDFGTLPLGAQDQPATPDVSVTNCSGLSSDIYARATDAHGVSASWSLVDSSETCADALGLDNYRLGLERSGSETGLGTLNKVVDSLSSGASGTHTARIFTACPGSTGSGTTMSMQIVFLATTGG